MASNLSLVRRYHMLIRWLIDLAEGEGRELYL